MSDIKDTNSGSPGCAATGAPPRASALALLLKWSLSGLRKVRSRRGTWSWSHTVNDRAPGEMLYGGGDNPAGYTPWLIKFDLSKRNVSGPTEHAYAARARAAGIAMPETRLFSVTDQTGAGGDISECSASTVTAVSAFTCIRLPVSCTKTLTNAITATSCWRRKR